MIDNQAHAGILRADKPIETRTDDRLARGRLVESISRQILSISPEDSIAIALNAPWGAGKTSFLHLLEERLKLVETDDMSSGAHPIVMHFNPWMYNNVEQLVKSFFSQLSRTIGHSNCQEGVKQIADNLDILGDVFLKIFTVADGSGTTALIRASQKLFVKYFW